MSDNIEVVVRLRPLLPRERGETINWKVAGTNTIVQTTATDPSPYSFDKVFDLEATNKELFDGVVRPIVAGALNGFNGTIFAYGQTSSGKTHTMIGTKSDPGIIPLTIQCIFEGIEATPDKQYLIRASYMEIYNENISDLLSGRSSVTGNKGLAVREDPNGNIYVADLKDEYVTDQSTLLSVMQKGDRNRHVGSTNMNERSSRSHTIFRIVVESQFAVNCDENDSLGSGEDQAVTVSHINLVDLAGSENASQTGATGDRLKEGSFINRSLFMLGRVIMQLSDGESFINFRDSKLTRILQNSLGGNARTAIVCNVTPVAVEQTHSTLRFASRAKNIKNKPVVNEVISDAALLKRYSKEINQLKLTLEEERQANRLDEVMQVKAKMTAMEQLNDELKEKVRHLNEKLITSSHTPKSTKKTRSVRRETWAAPALKSSAHLDLSGIKCPTSIPWPQRLKLPSVPELGSVSDSSFMTANEEFNEASSSFLTKLETDETSPVDTSLINLQKSLSLLSPPKSNICERKKNRRGVSFASPLLEIEESDQCDDDAYPVFSSNVTQRRSRNIRRQEWPQSFSLESFDDTVEIEASDKQQADMCAVCTQCQASLRNDNNLSDAEVQTDYSLLPKQKALDSYRTPPRECVTLSASSPGDGTPRNILRERILNLNTVVSDLKSVVSEKENCQMQLEQEFHELKDLHDFEQMEFVLREESLLTKIGECSTDEKVEELEKKVNSLKRSLNDSEQILLDSNKCISLQREQIHMQSLELEQIRKENVLLNKAVQDQEILTAELNKLTTENAKQRQEINEKSQLLKKLEKDQQDFDFILNVRIEKHKRMEEDLHKSLEEAWSELALLKSEDASAARSGDSDSVAVLKAELQQRDRQLQDAQHCIDDLKCSLEALQGSMKGTQQILTYEPDKEELVKENNLDVRQLELPCMNCKSFSTELDESNSVMSGNRASHCLDCKTVSTELEVSRNSVSEVRESHCISCETLSAELEELRVAVVGKQESYCTNCATFSAELEDLRNALSSKSNLPCLKCETLSNDLQNEIKESCELPCRKCEKLSAELEEIKYTISESRVGQCLKCETLAAELEMTKHIATEHQEFQCMKCESLITELELLRDAHMKKGELECNNCLQLMANLRRLVELENYQSKLDNNGIVSVASESKFVSSSNHEVSKHDINSLLSSRIQLEAMMEEMKAKIDSFETIELGLKANINQLVIEKENLKEKLSEQFRIVDERNNELTLLNKRLSELKIKNGIFSANSASSKNDAVPVNEDFSSNNNVERYKRIEIENECLCEELSCKGSDNRDNDNLGELKEQQAEQVNMQTTGNQLRGVRKMDISARVGANADIKEQHDADGSIDILKKDVDTGDVFLDRVVINKYSCEENHIVKVQENAETINSLKEEEYKERIKKLENEIAEYQSDGEEKNNLIKQLVFDKKVMVVELEELKAMSCKEEYQLCIADLNERLASVMNENEALSCRVLELVKGLEREKNGNDIQQSALDFDMKFQESETEFAGGHAIAASDCRTKISALCESLSDDRSDFVSTHHDKMNSSITMDEVSVEDTVCVPNSCLTENILQALTLLEETLLSPATDLGSRTLLDSELSVQQLAEMKQQLLELQRALLSATLHESQQQECHNCRIVVENEVEQEVALRMEEFVSDHLLHCCNGHCEDKGATSGDRGEGNPIEDRSASELEARLLRVFQSLDGNQSKLGELEAQLEQMEDITRLRADASGDSRLVNCKQLCRLLAEKYQLSEELQRYKAISEEVQLKEQLESDYFRVSEELADTKLQLNILTQKKETINKTAATQLTILQEQEEKLCLQNNQLTEKGQLIIELKEQIENLKESNGRKHTLIEQLKEENKELETRIRAMDDIARLTTVETENIVCSLKASVHDKEEHIAKLCDKVQKSEVQYAERNAELEILSSNLRTELDGKEKSMKSLATQVLELKRNLEEANCLSERYTDIQQRCELLLRKTHLSFDDSIVCGQFDLESALSTVVTKFNVKNEEHAQAVSTIDNLRREIERKVDPEHLQKKHESEIEKLLQELCKKDAELEEKKTLITRDECEDLQQLKHHCVTVSKRLEQAEQNAEMLDQEVMKKEKHIQNLLIQIESDQEKLSTLKSNLASLTQELEESQFEGNRKVEAINKLSEDVQTYKEKQLDLIQIIQNKDLKLEEFSALNEKLNSKLSEYLRTSHDEKLKLSEDYATKLESLQASYDSCRAIIEEREESHRLLEARYIHVSNECEECQARFNSLVGEHTRCQAELANVRSDCEKQEVKISESAKKVEKTALELVEATRLTHDLQLKCKVLEEKLRVVLFEGESHKKLLANKDSDIESLRRENETACDKADQLEERLRKLSSDHSECSSKFQELQEDRISKEQDCVALASRLALCESNNIKLTKEIDSYSQELHQTKLYLQQTKLEGEKALKDLCNRSNAAESVLKEELQHITEERDSLQRSVSSAVSLYSIWTPEQRRSIPQELAVLQGTDGLENNAQTVTELKKIVQEKESRIKQLDEELNDVVSHYESRHNNYVRMVEESDLWQVKRELHEYKQEISLLSTKANSLQENNTALLCKNNKLQEDLHEITCQLNRTNETLKLKDKVPLADGTIISVEPSQVEELRCELTQCKIELEEQHKQVKLYHTQLEEVRAELKQTLSKKKEERSTLREQVTQYQANVDALEKKNDQLQAEITTMQAKGRISEDKHRTPQNRRGCDSRDFSTEQSSSAAIKQKPVKQRSPFDEVVVKDIEIADLRRQLVTAQHNAAQFREQLRRMQGANDLNNTIRVLHSEAKPAETDPNQPIYGWRGGSHMIMSAKVLDLEREIYQLEKENKAFKQEVNSLGQHVAHYKKKAQEWKTAALIHQKHVNKLKADMIVVQQLKLNSSTSIGERKHEVLASTLQTDGENFLMEQDNVVQEAADCVTDVEVPRTEKPLNVNKLVKSAECLNTAAAVNATTKTALEVGKGDEDAPVVSLFNAPIYSASDLCPSAAQRRLYTGSRFKDVAPKGNKIDNCETQ